MIEQALERWHRFVAGDMGVLDELLADDVVFYSPVVYTPQRGKAVTKLFLEAAARSLGALEGVFRYSKHVVGEDVAALEFETEVDGKYVNGIDILRCDDTGRVVELRVMIRPLKGVNAVQERMGAMLASMQVSTQA